MTTRDGGGKVIVGIAMSLDGIINDDAGEVSRLYPDMEALRATASLQEAIRTTGAVVMGRRAYDMAQGDYTGYEFQTPIFVLTHTPPATGPKGENERLSVTFVTDGVASAIARARAAAGPRNVQVTGGASTGQQVLNAGLADELEITIVPVLLGGGLRFFEHLEPGKLALEQIGVSESPTRTDLRYRIVK
jgi:dihydrofolate reductase